MFEAHITIVREDYDKAKPIAAMWKFHMSNITDDIELGPGPKAYCTRSGMNFMELKNAMDMLARTLPANDVRVLRKKIEAIIVDERL